MGDEFNKFGPWEKDWQQAFEGSEHTPPSRVWQGLENSLMEQQLRRYKRKVFLYQWLAAASVMLLGIWAGWWMFFGQPRQRPLAATQVVTTQTGAGNSVASSGNLFDTFPHVGTGPAPTAVESAQGATQASAAGTEQANAMEGAAAIAGSANSGSASTPAARSSSNTPASASVFRENRLQADVSKPVERPAEITQLPLLGEELLILIGQEAQAELSLLNPSPRSLEGALLLADGRIEKEIRVVGITPKKGGKKNSFLPNGDFWLGASLASGFFNPNMTSNGQSLAWAEQPPVSKGQQMVYTANVDNWNEKERSMPSIHFKIDAAFRLSQRWMFQSSVQYGTYRVNTLSGSFKDPVSNKVYPLYYTNFSSNRLQVASPGSRIAAPVDAINTYRFLSVPLSVSYVLFERNIGIALSTGVSSEIFLSGQIDANGNNRLESYKLTTGDGSPLRRVHFNAQLGVQLFYRAGPNHLLTLEPTYKYAITDFHEDGTYFDSRPSQIGVAAGFRFILR